MSLNTFIVTSQAQRPESCVNLRILLLEHFPDPVHAFIESSQHSLRPSLIYFSHPEINDLYGTSPLMGENRWSWFVSGFPCSYALWDSLNVWISWWILDNHSTSAIFPDSYPYCTLARSNSRTVYSWTQWTDQWPPTLIWREIFPSDRNRSHPCPALSLALQSSLMHALYTTWNQLLDIAVLFLPLFPVNHLLWIKRGSSTLLSCRSMRIFPQAKSFSTVFM